MPHYHQKVTTQTKEKYISQSAESADDLIGLKSKDEFDLNKSLNRFEALTSKSNLTLEEIKEKEVIKNQFETLNDQIEKLIDENRKIKEVLLKKNIKVEDLKSTVFNVNFAQSSQRQDLSKKDKVTATCCDTFANFFKA